MQVEINMEQPDILTRQQSERLLEIYAGEKCSLKSFTLEPLGELNGLIAKQYKIKLSFVENGKDESAQLFLKSLQDANPVMYQIAKEMHSFEKESFFYGKFLPLMENYGFDCSFAPKGYFYENNNVVLEDLSLRSFKELPKNQPLDLEQCKKCLETIARFHATPVLYELKKSKELGTTYSLNDEYGEFLWDVIEDSSKDSGVIKYISNSVRGLCEVVDSVPLNGFDPDKLKSKLLQTLGVLLGGNRAHSSFRRTILHNDLWATNFLCHTDSGKIQSCKLIDFQTISYGPPAFDVLGFIYTNTRKSFRENHQEDLFKYYYDCFCDQLENHGVASKEILPESEFKTACDLYKLPEKLFSIVDRCVTFTSDEEYFEVSQSEETFAKFLFEERGRYMVKCFRENEEFKELIVEEIGDIASMLF